MSLKGSLKISRINHGQLKSMIPKGAVIPVVDALQRLIREALDRGSELAWGKIYLSVIGV